MEIVTLTMNPAVDNSSILEHVIAERKLRCSSNCGQRCQVWHPELFVKLYGSAANAAKLIADDLKNARGNTVVPPKGFFVARTEDPLKAGELERAAS